MTDPWDWYMYLHLVDFFMVNVGKDTIHGSHGYGMAIFCLFREFLNNHVHSFALNEPFVGFLQAADIM